MIQQLRRAMVATMVLLLPLHAHAQHMVSGQITDDLGEPLIGASVLEKGTSNGAITNVEGRYTLQTANGNAVLVISYLGYETLEEAVGGRSTINVSLLPDLVLLTEMVVTAQGFEEQADRLGYASAVVSDEVVVKASETTFLNALSGKASGVRISRNSGDPGAGAYIQIRGLSTITRDAQPLIVVDGVPIANDVRGNGSGRIAQQSRINDINPNDIESISVLKGASAAALWGTQALGGVIMITTKNGSYNQAMKVSVRSSYSIDQINRRYPLQTTFGQGNNGEFNARARDSWGDKISDRSGDADELVTTGEFFIDQDGNTWYPIANKNSQAIYDDSNFDQIFQNGYFWENNVSVSGGNENGTAFVSISDLNQTGIIRNNSDYRRSTFRFNGEQVLTDKLVVNANINYARSISNRIRRGASSSGLYLGLLRNPADFDITGYRGNYYSGPSASPIANRHRSYREPLAADGTPTYNNPLWTINEQENLALVNRFTNTLKFTYSPTKWLDFIARAGLDQYTEERKGFFTPGSAAGEYRTGRYDTELATNSIFNMDLIGRATHSIGENLAGTLLVGFNLNQKKRTVSGLETSNFIQFTDVASGIRDVDNVLPENVLRTNTLGMERTAGLYTSLTVDLYQQLFVKGTLRGEAASTFGNANNTFLFPSVSAAWQFHELLGLAPLSFAKLRVSYGEVGVQPGRYNTSNVFVSPSYSDVFGGDLNLGLFGNGGFVPSTARGNTSLRPERKKELEVGTDMRLLSDRLIFTATYFNNITQDVLLDFPMANSRGYDRIYANGATIANQGWEADLGYLFIDNNTVTWQANAIFTQVRNRVTDLAGVETVELGGLSAVNARAIEGQPLGVLWGSRTLRNENGDIVYDENGFPLQDEQEGIIGDPNPDWQGSFSTSLRYRGFTLNALLETYQGADIFAGTKSVLYNLGRWAGSDTESTFDQNLLDYNGNLIPMGTTFRGVVHDFGAGPVALTEPWYLADGGFFSGGNDELYIEDGSWTRLREIALSYSLENSWLTQRGLGSANFTITGRNLLMWSAFEGNDPDTNLSGVSPARGIDYFNNPGTKSYVFTVELTF